MNKQIDLLKGGWCINYIDKETHHIVIEWLNQNFHCDYKGCKGSWYGVKLGRDINTIDKAAQLQEITLSEFIELLKPFNPNVGETIEGSNDNVGWGRGIYFGSVGCNFGYAHVIKLEDGTICAVQHIRKATPIVTLTIDGVPIDIKTLSDSELLALKNS